MVLSCQDGNRSMSFCSAKKWHWHDNALMPKQQVLIVLLAYLNGISFHIKTFSVLYFILNLISIVLIVIVHLTYLNGISFPIKTYIYYISFIIYILVDILIGRHPKPNKILIGHLTYLNGISFPIKPTEYSTIFHS